MSRAGAPWRLRHAWRSESDRAALAVCADALAAQGVTLADAADEADALKLHGGEVLDLLAAGTPEPADVAAVAAAEQWAARLPAPLLRFAAHGGRWHGIPMGVHRANLTWLAPAIVRAVGGTPTSDAQAFIEWLDAARAHSPSPLAIGGDPRQVGVLFEGLVLASAGDAGYRRAFVELAPEALAGAAVQEALARLLRLRERVADEALSLPWREQLARVVRGEAAAAVMPDWARSTSSSALVEWPLPGTAAHFVAIVDFFVPLASSDAELSNRAARALTQPEVQRRFAAAKGCLPALHCAVGDCPDAASSRPPDAALVPSLTYDQCCSVALKNKLLDVVAAHFVQRGDPVRTARALADCAAG